MTTNPTTESHFILRFEDALVQAQLRGDVAELDRLIDEDLHFIGLGGAVYTKADDLAAHSSGQIRITKMVPLERHLQSLGDVVVVSALMDTEATVAGVPNAARLRYTRVWCRRGDTWRIVSGHMSLAEPA